MSYYRRKDLVKHAITTGGTDNRVIGAATTSYQALDSSDNGRTITGTFREGATFETGQYVYTHATLTLTRSRLIHSSTPGSPATITSSAVFTELWTARDAELSAPFDRIYYWEDYAGSAAVFNGTSDGTTPFQAMMDDIGTAIAAAGGGDFSIMLRGNVLLAGALQDTSWRNCQIKLPTVTAIAAGSGTTPQASLTIRSPHRKYNAANVTSLVSLAGGVGIGRIVSTLTSVGGTLPAVIGGRDNSGSPLGNSFTLLNLFMQDIEVVTASAAAITALNLEYVAAVDLRNVQCIHGDNRNIPTISSSPTGVCGIFTPRNANSAYTYGENVHAIGYAVGLVLNEHCTGYWGAWGCAVGAQLPASDHPSFVTRLMLGHCQVGLQSFGGATHFDIGQLDVEYMASPDTPTWQRQTYTLDDASNYVHGQCRYGMVRANVGFTTGTPFVKNGGTNFAVTNIG